MVERKNEEFEYVINAKHYSSEENIKTGENI